MRKLSCLLFSSWLSVTGSAAPRFSVETTQFVSAHNQMVIEQAFQFAFSEVRQCPPPAGNPFTADSDRLIQIQLTTTRDPLAVEEAMNNPDSDAFTATVGTNSKLVTIIFLLTDRLFWNPKSGKQYPDAYIRLVNALGHEVYGNLPQHLKLEFGVIPENDANTRIEEEIFAFQAGIDFLNRYLKMVPQDPATQKQVRAALKRDNAKLRTWQEAACSLRISKMPGNLPRK